MYAAIPYAEHYPKVMFLSNTITSRSFQKLPTSSTLLPVDIKETRRQSLIALIEKRFGGSQKKLADAILRADNYVSNVVNRRKNIGENVARDIESKLGLPRFSLDHASDSLQEQPLTHTASESIAKYDARAAPDSLESLKRSRELARIAHLAQFATAADLSKMADAMEKVLIEDRRSRENADTQPQKTGS